MENIAAPKGNGPESIMNTRSFDLPENLCYPIAIKETGDVMKNKRKFPIGRRTIKTALAVILSLAVVDIYGTTTSKLVFAMLGALAAVQPTFTESLESCITQIVGVFLGALAGGVLVAMHIPPVIAAGIGIVLVIVLYNGLRIRYSAGLACIIVVCICIDGETRPFTYALTRIWDTAIGLGIGMAINTLVFPYDNSRRIQSLMESLDGDVLRFLEEVFDGDEVLPNPDNLTRKVRDIQQQLEIFSNQKLLLRLRRQKADIERYRSCELKARELAARLEILSISGKPGRLNDENRLRLKNAGANIRDKRTLKHPQERDMVTNYHVRQILQAREEILDILKNEEKVKK